MLFGITILYGNVILRWSLPDIWIAMLSEVFSRKAFIESAFCPFVILFRGAGEGIEHSPICQAFLVQVPRSVENSGRMIIDAVLKNEITGHMGRDDNHVLGPWDEQLAARPAIAGTLQTKDTVALCSFKGRCQPCRCLDAVLPD
jgi:hypothetical protein